MSIAIPVVLDEIVKKAMAKDPAQRYVAAGDMLADLRMLQDALRFGRSLSWPLRAEAVQPGPSATGRGPGRKPQPVAPKMSAIRKEEDQERRSKREKVERDVPVWMWVIFTIGSTLFVAVVGMWIFQNLSRPVWIAVPNIKTLSVAEATSLLRESKLTLKIARHEPNEKYGQDSVLESDPEPGQKIRQGGEVSVIVSSGKGSPGFSRVIGNSPLNCGVSGFDDAHPDGRGSG